MSGRNSDNAFKITPAGLITEIIDRPVGPSGIAVDAAGNAYVTGAVTDNAFKITLDEDDDGVPDANDNCPNDPNKLDPGICGCGVSDADTDGDGTPDCFDRCPDDPTSIDCPGACGCGNGMDGMMVMPMMLLGIGWMRRRVGALNETS